MAIAAIPIIGAGLEELLTLLEGGGVVGTFARGALGGLVGFSVSDILNGLIGHPKAKMHVPQFALVDMHNNKVLVFVGRRRAYRFLLRPRRRSRTRVIREIVTQGTTVSRIP